MRNFPFYSLFQISKFGNFERLDVLHISFWIMGVFVKAVTALYCACSCIKREFKKNFAFTSSAVAFVLSLFMLNFANGQEIDYRMTLSLFLVFSVIIPTLTLIFKKKNYGDELVKMY